jgi:hypothetical protein
MTPQMVAALESATVAFRDMAVGLRARLLEVGNDPAIWILIDEQLLFVSHELHTLADRAELWRCQGELQRKKWLAFCGRAKVVHDKVSAWEKTLKVAGILANRVADVPFRVAAVAEVTVCSMTAAAASPQTTDPAASQY